MEGLSINLGSSFYFAKYTYPFIEKLEHLIY